MLSFSDLLTSWQGRSLPQIEMEQSISNFSTHQFEVIEPLLSLHSVILSIAGDKKIREYLRHLIFLSGIARESKDFSVAINSLQKAEEIVSIYGDGVDFWIDKRFN